MATISALVATAAASGIAFGSTGAARPAFAPAYVGTAQGTLRMPGQIDTWTVQGLTFKLQNARFARGRWGGTYLVTGGRVTFTSKATGECKSSTTASFSLGRMTWDTGSILFLQNLREPGYGYQARATKEHPVKVTQECNDRGGDVHQTGGREPGRGAVVAHGHRRAPLSRQAPARKPHGAVGVRHEKLDVEPCAAPLVAAVAKPSSARAGRRSAAAPR